MNAVKMYISHCYLKINALTMLTNETFIKVLMISKHKNAQKVPQMFGHSLKMSLYLCPAEESHRGFEQQDD